MEKLLVATTNPGKFKEIEVGFCGLDLELVFLGNLEFGEDVEENGVSFEENALIKARYFSEMFGMPAIADDSGILVDVLEGELGVKTRRWGAGAKASDEEWIEFFLKRMEGEVRRGARFVAAIALVGMGEEKVFVGETVGVVTEDLEAPIQKGIPLSSCFRPEGEEVVFEVLSDEEKNRISHRGKALVKLKEFLRKAL